MSMLALAFGAGGVVAVAASHQEFNKRAEPYREIIDRAANRFGVSGNVIAAVLWQESRFNSLAVGSLGEVGMGQFRDIALDDIRQNGHYQDALHVDQLTDPEKAIMATAALLRLNRQRTGSIVNSVRAYNVGVGNAQKSASAGLGYMSDVMKNAGVDWIMQSFDPTPKVIA